MSALTGELRASDAVDGQGSLTPFPPLRFLPYSGRMVRQDVAQLLTDEISRGTRPSFNTGRPVAVRSARGRLDVLGGLGADAGGTVAQMAVPARGAAAVQLRDEPVLAIH